MSNPIIILIAVINTDEQISEVLEREFEGCVINEEEEFLTIENVKYIYYSQEVKQMPIDEVTIYILEKA